MKKILLFAAVACLSIGSLFAQNKFKGTINYTLTSTGETEFQIPDQIKNAELKVYESKVLASSPIFLMNYGGMASNILVDGRKQYICMDLSQIFMYLSANDVELDYKGSSKILVSDEITQSEIDSLTIPVTEGFYIEYVSGETKTIAGKTAKKAVMHAFDEDGEDHPTTFWYCDEIGPEVNIIFNGIKGVALEYSMNIGEGRQITLTATEIKEGKVKEVDVLLPDGFESITKDQFTALFKQINEEMQYLQE